MTPWYLSLFSICLGPILCFYTALLRQSSYFFSLTWAVVGHFLALLLLSVLRHCVQLDCTQWQQWDWTYLARYEQALHLCGVGALCSTRCVREGGCQQCMHENDWHFSDTPVGSDWLCWSRSGGFLQITGWSHRWLIFYTADLYLILLSNHNANFSKYNKTWLATTAFTPVGINTWRKESPVKSKQTTK